MASTNQPFSPGSSCRRRSRRRAAAILGSARERDIPVRAVDQLRDTTRKGSLVRSRATPWSSATPRCSPISACRSSFGDWPDRLRRRGEHVLFVAIDGRAAAFFGVANARWRTQNSEDKEEQHAALSDDQRVPDNNERAAVARSTESVELTDGQQFDLHISPVTKRFGDRDVRMLAYNGSIPGPTLRVQQGSTLASTSPMAAISRRPCTGMGCASTTGMTAPWRHSRPFRLGAPSLTASRSLILACIGITRTFARTTARRWVYGTIIVVPADENYWPAVNRELSVTLDDLLLEGGTVAPFDTSRPTYTAMGRFGNTMLVNGEPELPLASTKGGSFGST